MKRLAFLLTIAVLLTACEKNVIGDFAPNPEAAEVVTGTSKKGSAYSYNKSQWSFKTSDSKTHWMYTWGNVEQEETPANVEYVPMFWGKGSVNDENIDLIKGRIAEGTVNFVLGFNEPDGADQANMTVDEAIALWPQLEELNVPLVSPATVNPTNAWMQDFMSRAQAEGLRVDYVAVHHYGGANPLGLINKLKETYELYGKPIWITEFAVADWAAATPEANRYSEEEVLAFMQEVLPALDNIDWVHRYSWFDGQGRAPLATSALFDDNDNITPLGEFYANHQPNEEIGPGQEIIEEPEEEDTELVVNGGFELGDATGWSGFKNGAVGAGTTAPYSGNYCGRIENGDGSFFQNIPVEPGVTYTLRFWSKWNEAVQNSFTGRIRNNANNENLFDLDMIPTTTEWTETVFDFTVPAGVSEIRLLMFKGQAFPPFFIDDVSLKPKEITNLVANGDFELGDATGWSGFKNGAVGAATTEPHSGDYSGRIENGDGSFFQNIAVEPGKTYTLKFWSKWNEPVQNSFTGRIRNNANNENLFDLDMIPISDQWELTVFEFTVPDGVTEIRLLMFKGQGFPPFFIDDVSLAE